MEAPAPRTLIPTIDFEPSARLAAGIVTLCFAGVFYNEFWKLGYKWWNDGNWSHGWAIPLFSLWLVYYNWEKIRGLPIRAAWLGLPVMLFGLAVYQWSLWGLKVGYVAPVSMMICLLGVIIMVAGLPAMRYLLVPWAYLFFAIPLPGRTYFQLTDPLRRLAATVSASVLSMLPNLEVERSGSVLECTYKGVFSVLGVEDACSGMRSTITLCALGVAVTFMSNRPMWQRIVMIAMCVPIATFCNMLRVLITCSLYIFVDPKYAGGTYHTILGLVMLILAFGIFNGLGWVLNNLVVEEPAPPDAEASLA